MIYEQLLHSRQGVTEWNYQNGKRYSPRSMRLLGYAVEEYLGEK